MKRESKICCAQTPLHWPRYNGRQGKGRRKDHAGAVLVGVCQNSSPHKSRSALRRHVSGSKKHSFSRLWNEVAPSFFATTLTFSFEADSQASASQLRGKGTRSRARDCRARSSTLSLPFFLLLVVSMLCLFILNPQTTNCMGRESMWQVEGRGSEKK